MTLFLEHESSESSETKDSIWNFQCDVMMLIIMPFSCENCTLRLHNSWCKHFFFLRSVASKTLAISMMKNDSRSWRIGENEKKNPKRSSTTCLFFDCCVCTMKKHYRNYMFAIIDGCNFKTKQNKTNEISKEFFDDPDYSSSKLFLISKLKKFFGTQLWNGIYCPLEDLMPIGMCINTQLLRDANWKWKLLSVCTILLYFCRWTLDILLLWKLFIYFFL